MINKYISWEILTNNDFYQMHKLNNLKSRANTTTTKMVCFVKQNKRKKNNINLLIINSKLLFISNKLAYARIL